jgi:hypothetical protein
MGIIPDAEGGGYGYGNCVAASNLTSNNNTRLVMEPCDGSTGRVFRLG